MAKRCNPKTPISLEWFTVQHYSAYSVHIWVDVWAFSTKLHTIILNHVKLLCCPCRSHMAESDYFCSKCQRRETQRLITISPGYLLTYNLSHRPTDTLGVAWKARVGTAWEEEHALHLQHPSEVSPIFWEHESSTITDVFTVIFTFLTLPTWDLHCYLSSVERGSSRPTPGQALRPTVLTEALGVRLQFASILPTPAAVLDDVRPTSALKSSRGHFPNESKPYLCY